MMYDDGMHGDGAANDGIFAAPFAHAHYGGGYNVVILAQTPDPADPGNMLEREWNGGFWIKGPRPEIKEDPNDKDNDGMYDPWEERCKLDTTRNDSQEDMDGDGLTNGQEAELGTSPCDPDTDNGGETDGSEVLTKNKRDPLNPRRRPSPCPRPLGCAPAQRAHPDRLESPALLHPDAALHLADPRRPQGPVRHRLDAWMTAKTNRTATMCCPA